MKGGLVLPDAYYSGLKLRVKFGSHPRQVLQLLRCLDFQLGGIICDVPQLTQSLLKGPHFKLKFGNQQLARILSPTVGGHWDPLGGCWILLKQYPSKASWAYLILDP